MEKVGEIGETSRVRSLLPGSRRELRRLANSAAQELRILSVEKIDSSKCRLG